MVRPDMVFLVESWENLLVMNMSRCLAGGEIGFEVFWKVLMFRDISFYVLGCRVEDLAEVGNVNYVYIYMLMTWWRETTVS